MMILNDKKGSQGENLHPHKPQLTEGHRLSIGRIVLEVTMIVFSILFALFLESLHERAKQKELAATALERIQAEIESNAEAIRQRLPLHEQELAIFTARAQNPDTVVAVPDGITLGLNPPLLYSTAFETASSTQALTHMDFDLALAVSKAYTSQRRMALIENNWMSVYLSPGAYEYKYRESFFSLQQGIFGSYVLLENKLLKIYEETLARIDGKP
jgi:hypothetical protein